jgi:hypothetical protein
MLALLPSSEEASCVMQRFLIGFVCVMCLFIVTILSEW